VLVLALSGCTANDIHVTDSAVSDEAPQAFLFSTSAEPRTEFTTDDDKVTLSVTFGYNMVATYFVYAIEWVAPGERIYLRAPLRTLWGTHRKLVAELPIRGQGAAQLTGSWKVRLYLEDRLLVERGFALRAANEEAVNRALATVPTECPPLPHPPGECIDRAWQE
jgi:hypothetical protein